MEINMNIQGLDYNTQREKLLLPEYGREVQEMVKHAMTRKTKDMRQVCAENIICIMERMFPQVKECANYKQKLWEQLAIMSNFELDVDYPFDVSSAKRISTKPQPMQYQTGRIPVMHYGKLLFSLFEELKNMPEGPARDELAMTTAKQMKRNLLQWSNGSSDDEKIASDLARYTNGVIQLDPERIKLDAAYDKDSADRRKKKR